MASTVVPPDIRWTDVIPLPTQTATQPTGAPSAVPKDPASRTSTVSAEFDAEVSKGTEPVPTALSVESSITNCPHAAEGWDGTVPVDPGPEPLEEGGWVPSVPTATPGDVTPPADVLPPSVAPRCAGWTTTGCAQAAPGGHVVVGGTTPTGGHGAASLHPPVVLLASPKTRIVTPDVVVRVKRRVYGIWTAMAGRPDAPDRPGARARASPAGNGRRRRGGKGLDGRSTVDQVGAGQDARGDKDHRHSHRSDHEGASLPGSPDRPLDERTGVRVGVDLSCLPHKVGPKAVLEIVAHGSITFLRSANARWMREPTVPGRQRRARAISASGRSA